MKDEPETDRRTFLPIARILVPIDFSDFSRAAVERAAALARPGRAEITAMFVLPCSAPAAEGDAECPRAAEADDNMISAVAEDVEDFLRPALSGLPVRVCVERGDAASRIVDQARESEADVIVMGTHGRSGVKRWALGSVLDGVLRSAPCPVLAVSRPLPRSRRAKPVPGSILCAVGLSGRSPYTLSYALELGRYTGAAVTALHVSPGVVRPGARARRQAEQREALHAVVPPERACRELVLPGEPHRRIVRQAEAQRAGLIVLGSDARGLGPTAARVVREARAPVLIVPLSDEERT